MEIWPTDISRLDTSYLFKNTESNYISWKLKAQESYEETYVGMGNFTNYQKADSESKYDFC